MVVESMVERDQSSHLRNRPRMQARDIRVHS